MRVVDSCTRPVYLICPHAQFAGVEEAEAGSDRKAARAVIEIGYIVESVSVDSAWYLMQY